MAECFIVVCRDRHSDLGLTVHHTVEGANRKVEELKAMFGKYAREPIIWREQTYGRPRWVRYVDCYDDGPKIYIERREIED